MIKIIVWGLFLVSSVITGVRSGVYQVPAAPLPPPPAYRAPPPPQPAYHPAPLRKVPQVFENDCEELKDEYHIVEFSNWRSKKCWAITVPRGRYVCLTLVSLDDSRENGRVTVSVDQKKDNITFTTITEKTNITALNDVKIYFIPPVHSWYSSYAITKFQFFYSIEDILCARTEKFRCSRHSCVPQAKVCDGTRDCSNGKDELDCEKGVEAIEGVNTTRSEAITWLRAKLGDAGIWHRNSERAIIALKLADVLAFNGTRGGQDEMLVKELELKIAVALLRNGTDPVTSNELGMYIHCLLATCLNPRRFFGFDLVKLLKDQVEDSIYSPHPIASLALCNAKEAPSSNEVQRLLGILDSNSSYPFLLDVQAIAVMALTCIKSNGQNINETDIESRLNTTILDFQRVQQPSGSFGNMYTTSLIAQALLATGQEESKQWKMSDAIKFLMKQNIHNSSALDLLPTSLILPVLNGKSLVDIAKVNCSGFSKELESVNDVSDIENKLGSKISVKYLLCVGDKMDRVHSFTLRIPVNVTAYEVMRLAASSDPKYRFESHVVDGKMYVYSVSGIANDPEASQFWLFYLGQTDNNDSWQLVTESPDDIVIEDGQFLILWYKTAVV